MSDTSSTPPVWTAPWGSTAADRRRELDRVAARWSEWAETADSDTPPERWPDETDR